MSQFRILATWPFVVEAASQKEKKPQRRRRESWPLASPSRQMKQEGDAMPRFQEEARGSSHEANALLSIWDSRHETGMLEALERMNELLEAPVLDTEATEEVSKRIETVCDMPAILKKLLLILRQCAIARQRLETAETSLSMTELFRVLDPHGSDRCDTASLDSFMRDCGLSEKERQIALNAFAPQQQRFVYLETFLKVITVHTPQKTGEGAAHNFLRDPNWTPATPRRSSSSAASYNRQDDDGVNPRSRDNYDPPRRRVFPGPGGTQHNS